MTQLTGARRVDARSRTATTTLTVPSLRRLVWLIPAAYALHIVEELTGDFPGWVTHTVGGRFSDSGFVINNLVFMIIVLTVVSLYAHRPTPRRATVVLVWTSANLFWDALFHLSTTALFGVYSPGLVTAALLYLPLCLLLAAVAVQERVVSRPRLLATLSGGLVIFGFVVWYGLFHFAV